MTTLLAAMFAATSVQAAPSGAAVPESPCVYVADHYNRDLQAEITNIPQWVAVDEAHRHVHLGVTTIGSVGIPEITVTDDQGHDFTEQPISKSGALPFGQSHEANMSTIFYIRLMALKSAIYAITENAYHAPLGVFDWEGKQQCRFTTKTVSRLAQNDATDVCRALLHGALPSMKPAKEAPSEKALDLAKRLQLAVTSVDSFDDVDLTGNGQKDRIALFSGQMGGECFYSGLTLWNNDGPEDSNRNQGLAKAQNKFEHCQELVPSIVTYNGTNFIEIDRETMEHNDIPRRTLLKLTKSGVQTLCRVIDHALFESVEISK